MQKVLIKLQLYYHHKYHEKIRQIHHNHSKKKREKRKTFNILKNENIKYI